MYEDVTWEVYDNKKLIWEVHKCSVEEWINATLNDKGLYEDITDKVNSPYTWIVQGNNDTLFIVDVEDDSSLSYYLGYLKS